MYKYYSIMRPVGLGTVPSEAGNFNTFNFDSRTYCDEIGREAWGYIECENEIAPERLKQYELVSANQQMWWCVTANVKEDGTVIAAITNTREDTVKPEDSTRSTKHGDLYKNWFESREKANEWISEIGAENPSPSDAIDMSEKEKPKPKKVSKAQRGPKM